MIDIEFDGDGGDDPTSAGKQSQWRLTPPSPPRPRTIPLAPCSHPIPYWSCYDRESSNEAARASELWPPSAPQSPLLWSYSTSSFTSEPWPAATSTPVKHTCTLDQSRAESESTLQHTDKGCYMLSQWPDSPASTSSPTLSADVADLEEELEAASIATEMALLVLRSDSGNFGNHSLPSVPSSSDDEEAWSVRQAPAHPSKKTLLSHVQLLNPKAPSFFTGFDESYDVMSSVRPIVAPEGEPLQAEATSPIRKKGRARMSQEKRRRLARRKEREALLNLGLDPKTCAPQLPSSYRPHRPSDAGVSETFPSTLSVELPLSPVVTLSQQARPSPKALEVSRTACESHSSSCFLSTSATSALGLIGVPSPATERPSHQFFLETPLKSSARDTAHKRATLPNAQHDHCQPRGQSVESLAYSHARLFSTHQRPLGRDDTTDPLRVQRHPSYGSIISDNDHQCQFSGGPVKLATASSYTTSYFKDAAMIRAASSPISPTRRLDSKPTCVPSFRNSLFDHFDVRMLHREHRM